MCRRRNWNSNSISRLRQLTETTLAVLPRKVSCEDDVVRATDGMKSMFQMANLFPTIAGDDSSSDKKKKKKKKNKNKKQEGEEEEEEEELKELNINCQDRDGHTPLMLVCIHAGDEGLRECVHILLSHPETNVNLRSNDGNNALHLLCSNNNSSSSEQMLQVARMLIENGLDADDTNGKGRTALQNLMQAGRNKDNSRSSAPSNKSSLIQFLITKSSPLDDEDDDDNDVTL
jgi:ankyrin repeat protein